MPLEDVVIAGERLDVGEGVLGESDQLLAQPPLRGSGRAVGLGAAVDGAPAGARARALGGHTRHCFGGVDGIASGACGYPIGRSPAHVGLAAAAAPLPHPTSSCLLSAVEAAVPRCWSALAIDALRSIGAGEDRRAATVSWRLLQRQRRGGQR